MRRKNPFRFFLMTLLLCSYLGIKAENGTLEYKDKVYKEDIHSVLLYESSYFLSDPVIEFNSGQQLLLEFDELGADYKQYRYTFVHCDHAWQPSDILVTEYLNGYPDDIIFSYQFSTGTTQNYVHYELKFPTPNMKPILSGNYILIVFDDDKNKPIITKRFFILENFCAVLGIAQQATFPQYSGTHQEIDFSINSSKYNITNPYNDMHVVILQNQNWNTGIFDLKPQFINGNVLDFNYNEENLMPALNEFRQLDLKSLINSNFRIAGISRNEDNQFAVEVQRDLIRTDIAYLFDQDINGKFAIKTQERDNSSIQSEYVNTHFELETKEALQGGDVYIMGALVNWCADERSKMKFNEYKGIYECHVLLKQGYYNYQYVFVPKNKSKHLLAGIEGNHFQTENNYQIFIYHRSSGRYYDRLIGYKQLNSIRR
jgi:hypothetical protein